MGYNFTSFRRAKHIGESFSVRDFQRKIIRYKIEAAVLNGLKIYLNIFYNREMNGIIGQTDCC